MRRADVYSLGCLLFECLTGEVPFVRDSDIAVVFAHLDEPPPKPSERVPELPPAARRGNRTGARQAARRPPGELRRPRRRRASRARTGRARPLPAQARRAACSSRDRRGCRRRDGRTRRALRSGADSGAHGIGRPHRSRQRQGDGALQPVGASGRGRNRAAAVGGRLPPGHALAHRSAHGRKQQHSGDRQSALARDPRRARLRRQ